MAIVGERLMPTLQAMSNLRPRRRCCRTIKEDEVDLAEYQDSRDAHHQLGRFLDAVYTHQRIHSALDYLTSAEFEAQWRSTQPQTRAH
jgi:transposase InsO family protein